MKASTIETIKNAAIGAVVTFVVTFIPLLGFLSPVFGGGVSGYMQNRGASGGAWVGIIMAVFSGIPALLLGAFAVVLGSIPLLSGSIIGSIIGFIGSAGGLLVIGLWFLWTIYALILGLVGGIAGGAIASD